MTRWYVTGSTPKDAPDQPPDLSSRLFDAPAAAWGFADNLQKLADDAGEGTTWGVYSVRPVGRVTVREQGGQE